MADEDNSLAPRRSKRSTFGNRLEAVLAEFTETTGAPEEADGDEDKDFVVPKDEEDVFEPDFEESSEDEAKGDEAEGAEKVAQEEEKQDRRALRARTERATAAAHARQKATFNPQVSTPSQPKTPKPKAKGKRRVALGGAVDAATGEVLLGSTEGGTRHSRRVHTVRNTSATAERMRDAEKKVTPKKVKAAVRAPTQDELLARALDMEEGNIVEHRDYLSREEEKRRRARVVRAAVGGPVLRWVSRTETVARPRAQKEEEEEEEEDEPEKMQVDLPQPAMDAFTAAYSSYLYAGAPEPVASPSTAGPSSVAPSLYVATPEPPLLPSTIGPSSLVPSSSAVVYPPTTERVARNYVVHELDQNKDASLPRWEQTMRAMFGDHVRWEDLKVYFGKSRPLSRPVQSCPLTGLTAKYIDPRTNVPFADVRAYRALTAILEHQYVWSEEMGCYVAREDEMAAPGMVE